MTNLSVFEERVMDKLLDGGGRALSILREQFQVAKVLNRQLTEVGFFIEFSVPSDAPIVSSSPSFEINDVVSEIRGIENGAGFVLYVRDGKLATLEGFTFDENWPKEISDFKLDYREKSRNIPL
jgi:hypothetical protein